MHLDVDLRMAERSSMVSGNVHRAGVPGKPEDPGGRHRLQSGGFAAKIRSVQRPSEPIYFDHNATTPLAPEVREAMLPFLGPLYGNPSSIHAVGREARAHLDAARERIAAMLGCKPSEFVFTSGGTEANALALCGAARRLASKGRHLITTAVEHHAVLHPLEYLARQEGFELTVVPVARDGRVDPQAIQAALRPDTLLVSVMAVNNETGTVQPVAEIGRLCRTAGVLFHTDAVQWFGKLPFTGIQQFEADLVTLCGHKFYGPKGAGLLYIRSPLQIDPILLGGAQELERRAGTENVAAAVGLSVAVDRFLKPPVFSPDPLLSLSQRLRSKLCALEGVTVQGSWVERMPNTVAVTVTGTDSTALLAGLDLAGVCASSGSACASGSLTPSHVLLAMGLSRDLASSLIRFSMGRHTTEADVDQVAATFAEVVARVRAVSLPLD